MFRHGPNPQNVGQLRCGVTVEDGRTAMADAVRHAELILRTGSTISNGTVVNYLELDKDVLFFGITAAGAGASGPPAALLHGPLSRLNCWEIQR